MNASEGLRAQRLQRLAVVAVGLLAYWRLIFWTPPRSMAPLVAWLFHTTDPYPQLIFLMSAALVYRRRAALREAMSGGRPSPVLAAPFLFAGASLFAWAHYVDAMDLVLVSFLIASLGAAVYWYGTRFARELAIPWVVLAFAYPAPAVLTNQAFYALRLSSASQATALLQLAGIPVVREGNVIFGTHVIARVVDTCSGLRSMEMLTLAAVFFVCWFPARRARQVLVVVLAPAIAYLFNLFRVAAMTLWPSSEFSANHTQQGLAVFLGAIVCLIAVDRVLGRLLPGRPPRDRAPRRQRAELASQPGANPAAPPRGELRGQPDAGEGAQADRERGSDAKMESTGAPRRRDLANPKHRLTSAPLALLAVAMLGMSIGMPQWNPPVSTRVAGTTLPEQVDGWTQARKLLVDRGYLWTVRYAKHDYWAYERDGDEVSVFVGDDDRSNRRRSLLSRKNAVPGHGWEVEERGPAALEFVTARVERVVARSETSRVLTYHWYDGTGGLASEALRALLALDQSRFRRAQPARVIRLEIALGPTPIEREEAEAKLRAFAANLVDALRGQPTASAPPRGAGAKAGRQVRHPLREEAPPASE